MSRELIDPASAATAASERAIESAQNLLKLNRPVNRYGVYMDAVGVMADLAAASRDITAAVKAIAATDWPTPADYREASADD